MFFMAQHLTAGIHPFLGGIGCSESAIIRVFISLFALKIYSDPFEGKTTKGEILMFCVLLTEDQTLFFSADRSMSLRYLHL